MTKLSLLCFSCAVVAGLMLFLSGCETTSQNAQPTLEELFAQADANRDGKVSREEFIDFMITEVFQQYDKNGDGIVDKEEFLAGWGTEDNFRRINRDGGAGITLDGAKKSRIVRETMVVPFDEADQSGSGYVTWEEFQEYRKRVQPYVR
jgi:Ca2+-binding EF-hand superfamily protein